ncbi:hypothetical protein ACX0HA_07130 [Flavobacterium hauense]
MNDDLIDIFEIFITTPDKNIAEINFELLITHFSGQKKDTTYFVKLKNDFFHYKPWEIIGIHSALKVEFERLSGLRIH